MLFRVFGESVDSPVMLQPEQNGIAEEEGWRPVADIYVSGTDL
jgi:hypothetical protein